MTREPFTDHWLGRCPVKGCKCILHIDVPMVRERWTETHHNHAHGYSYPVNKSKDSTAPPFPQHFHPFELGLMCSTHKRQLGWMAVNGHYSEEHVCDARCMNAIGPNCECSCGGQNHGRGHNVKLLFEPLTP